MSFWDAVKRLEKKYGLDPLPWEPGDDTVVAPSIREEVAAALDPSETPEQALERLDKFLVGLSRDQSLSPQRCAAFFEAHDRIALFLTEGGDATQSHQMAHKALAKAKDALKEAM